MANNGQTQEMIDNVEKAITKLAETGAPWPSNEPSPEIDLDRLSNLSSDVIERAGASAAAKIREACDQIVLLARNLEADGALLAEDIQSRARLQAERLTAFLGLAQSMQRTLANERDRFAQMERFEKGDGDSRAAARKA